MAELKNLIVNGVARVNGDVYVSDMIYGTASNAISAAYAPYTNTDRYVNSAAFASTGSNGANGVKMTLTRAGSDTAQIVATIPVATTSAAGVVTGTQVSSWNGKQAAISDLTTIRSNAANGNTAYGWGNHASAGYVKSSGVTSVTLTTASNYVSVDSAAAITTTGTRKIDLTAATKGKIESGSVAFGWGNHASAGYWKWNATTVAGVKVNSASRADSAATAGSATSAGNADTVDNLHASDFTRFYLSPLDNGASANSAQSWFVDTMPANSAGIVYNVPGAEKTIIAGKSSDCGHMLQLNYDDSYLRILRYRAGAWQTSDWEKISAGYADIAGAATTATSASRAVSAASADSVAWGNVSGKPSTFAPSAHDHNRLTTPGDQRAVATSPNDYQNTLQFRGLKNAGTIGISTSNNYAYVVGLRGWQDRSGGDSHELAYTNDGIYHRMGNASETAWGAWSKIIESTDTSSWASAAANSHTHSNKTVLDGITAAKTSSWDGKWTYNEATIKAVKVNNATAADSATNATNATTAGKLSTGTTGNVGQAVYFSNGTPALTDIGQVACPGTSSAAGSGGTVTLQPGVVTNLGSLTGNVTIALANGNSNVNGHCPIYCAVFTSSGGSITLPAEIDISENSVDIEDDGLKYEISIMNNLAIVVRAAS